MRLGCEVKVFFDARIVDFGGRFDAVPIRVEDMASWGFVGVNESVGGTANGVCVS